MQRDRQQTLFYKISCNIRQRLIPLMTQEDSSTAAAQAAIRAATRNKFKSKIGDLQFSLSRYEKLVRATVPIKNDEKTKFLLLLTFDRPLKNGLKIS